MSRSGEVTVEWAGEERVFRLAIGQWRKIQEKCDVGPEELLGRLARSILVRAKSSGLSASAALTLAPASPWRVDDVREPILQGLLGAGLELNAAARLVRDWVDDRPLFEALPLAFAIVLGALSPPEDETPPPGEPQGESPTNLSPEESSASPDTTKPAAPSDSPPARSTTSPSGSSRRRSADSTGPTAPRKSRRPRRPTS